MVSRYKISLFWRFLFGQQREIWLAEFLVVGGFVKLSIGFFDVEVSVPHNNYTSLICRFDENVVSLLKVRQSPKLFRREIGTSQWYTFEITYFSQTLVVITLHFGVRAVWRFSAGGSVEEK